jgi:hypothetical protein
MVCREVSTNGAFSSLQVIQVLRVGRFRNPFLWCVAVEVDPGSGFVDHDVVSIFPLAVFAANGSKDFSAHAAYTLRPSDNESTTES